MEGIHVYDRIEQNKLIAPFKFSQEQFHLSTSHNNSTTSVTDHSLQLEHTSDKPSISNYPYQDHIVPTVLKELKPRNTEMGYWSVLSDCVSYIISSSQH